MNKSLLFLLGASMFFLCGCESKTEKHVKEIMSIFNNNKIEVDKEWWFHYRGQVNDNPLIWVSVEDPNQTENNGCLYNVIIEKDPNGLKIDDVNGGGIGIEAVGFDSVLALKMTEYFVSFHVCSLIIDSVSATWGFNGPFAMSLLYNKDGCNDEWLKDDDYMTPLCYEWYIDKDYVKHLKKKNWPLLRKD